jgi:hypothetical protein
MVTQNHLDWFAARLSIAVYDTNQEYRMSPISRLKDKIGKASGVAQRATSAIEAEADALIAQEDVIKAETADAFAPHKAILAEASTELQAVKDALSLMSNGGPPLTAAEPIVPGSGASPSIAPDRPRIDTGEVEHIKLQNGETNSVTDG